MKNILQLCYSVLSIKLWCNMINLNLLFKHFSKTLEINKYRVKIKNLFTSFENFKIVQISDLHVNKWNIDFIEDCINKVNELNADILVITGDTICHGKKYLNDINMLLDRINVNYGKYACLGNHDHSDDDYGQNIKKMYFQSDINLLDNLNTSILKNGEKLHLAGCDDVELGYPDVLKSLKNIQEGANLIYLSHNPVIFDEISHLKNCLVLSGHTHGMQLNFRMFDNFYKNTLKTTYLSGEYKNKNSVLYVNKGLGTAVCTPDILGLKLTINTPRINSNPEITVFELTSDNE